MHAIEPGLSTIPAQIDVAIAVGQKTVRIKPGVYHASPPEGKAPHIMLRSIRGLEIDATGVTLVCERLNRAVDIMQCSDLTLRGLTIDYAPLPMTQGTIVGFGPMREWTDVRIHAGYPAPLALKDGWGFLWTSDAKTRRIKPGTANRPNQSITDMGGGVWRVSHGVPVFDQAAVGDFLRIPQPVEKATGLVAAQCTNLTLIGVTVHSSPLMHAGDATPRKVDNTAAIFLHDIQDALIEHNELVRPGPHLGPRPISTQNVAELQAEQAFTYQ